MIEVNSAQHSAPQGRQDRLGTADSPHDPRGDLRATAVQSAETTGLAAAAARAPARSQAWVDTTSDDEASFSR